MKKRISKVILATALLFGSVATNIKASDKVDFVAIGDSITTGYGLDGYREPDSKVNPPVLANKGADYTKVADAIASIPTDLSIYTDESVQILNEALEAVVADKNSTEQKIVDGYAEAIGNAIK
ncbi:MAG: hypothetical protein RSC10_04995, partial [Longicatena sp.]